MECRTLPDSFFYYYNYFLVSQQCSSNTTTYVILLHKVIHRELVLSKRRVDFYLGYDGSLCYKHSLCNSAVIMSHWAILNCFFVEYPIGLWSYMTTAAHAWFTVTDYPKLLIEHFLTTLRIYRRLPVLTIFFPSFFDYLCHVQFDQFYSRNFRESHWNGQIPAKILIHRSTGICLDMG